MGELDDDDASGFIEPSEAELAILLAAVMAPAVPRSDDVDVGIDEPEPPEPIIEISLPMNSYSRLFKL